MMALPGGKERTKEEYADLAARCGLRLRRMMETRSGDSGRLSWVHIVVIRDVKHFKTSPIPAAHNHLHDIVVTSFILAAGGMLTRL
jgi:hypothetical protein